MLYDSMMNKINPRTLGAVGNRTNLDQNDSVTKHARQIGRSGPVNSNSRTDNTNLMATPDYEQILPHDVQMRNGGVMTNPTEFQYKQTFGNAYQNEEESKSNMEESEDSDNEDLSDTSSGESDQKESLQPQDKSEGFSNFSQHVKH
jgi:hypothetical protein